MEFEHAVDDVARASARYIFRGFCLCNRGENTYQNNIAYERVSAGIAYYIAHTGASEDEVVTEMQLGVGIGSNNIFGLDAWQRIVFRILYNAFCILVSRSWISLLHYQGALVNGH